MSLSTLPGDELPFLSLYVFEISLAFISISTKYIVRNDISLESNTEFLIFDKN